MDLARDVGVSPRHLSFIETGRSKPSPELLLGLADVLEVPLRERNAFLLAAGYAPHFQQRSLEDPSMIQVRAAVERLLGSHDPYPGVALDLLWNVVLANDAAQRLVALLPARVAGPPLNVFRACLHPDGLATRTLNFAEWAAYLLGQLHRLQVLTADPDVTKLANEVARYPTVAELGDWRNLVRPEESALLVPWRLRLESVELSLFTTLTTFGTPQDITLAELAVELFYPADEPSEAFLRRS